MSKVYLVVEVDEELDGGIQDHLEFFKEVSCYVSDTDEESASKIVGLSFKKPKSEYDLIEQKVRIPSTKKVWNKVRCDNG